MLVERQEAAWPFRRRWLPDGNHELSHVRGLRAVAGNDEVRGLSASDLDALDGKICQTIHDLASKALPNTHTPCHRFTSARTPFSLHLHLFRHPIFSPHPLQSGRAALHCIY
ncbi:MAG: hypothetical protein Kow00122_07310 [Thermoleophilia bacterium]